MLNGDLDFERKTAPKRGHRKSAGGQGGGRQVFGLSLVLLFTPSPGHALPNPTPRSILGFEPGPENTPEAVMAPQACGA